MVQPGELDVLFRGTTAYHWQNKEDVAGAHEDGPTAKRSYRPDQHLGTRGSPRQNPGEAAAGGHGRVFTVNTLAVLRASARTQF